MKSTFLSIYGRICPLSAPSSVPFTSGQLCSLEPILGTLALVQCSFAWLWKSMEVLPCAGLTPGQNMPQCLWTRLVSPLYPCTRGPHTVADTTQLSSQHIPAFKDLELCPQHRGRAHVSRTWVPCMYPPIPEVTFQLKTCPRAPPCFCGGQQRTSCLMAWDIWGADHEEGRADAFLFWCPQVGCGFLGVAYFLSPCPVLFL